MPPITITAADFGRSICPNNGSTSWRGKRLLRCGIATWLRTALGQKPALPRCNSNGSPQLADIRELRCISCYDCSMPLTLRPTGLSSPAYADQPDYIVCEDGKAIGRMYEDRQTLPELRWFWSRRRRGSSAGAGRRCHSRRHVRRRKTPTTRQSELDRV